MPDEHAVMGVPGRIARETNDDEKKYLEWLARHYVELAQSYVQTPTDPRFKPWGT